MQQAISIGAQRLTYEIDSTDAHRTVVLLHAFPLNAHMWDDTARRLSRSYRVIRPHWRGFGPVAPPPGLVQQLSMDDLARNVAAICSHANVSSAAFVGCSIGGYALCALLRLHSELVSAAVFANSRPEADTEEGRQNRYRTNAELRAAIDKGEQRAARSVFAERMLPRLLGVTTLHEDAELVARVRAWIEEAPLEAVISLNDCMARRPDSTDVVRNLQVPVLVIAGEEDAVVPLEAARHFHSIVPGARIAVIPQAGHLSNLENPAVFNKALDEFLSFVFSEARSHNRESA